MRLNRFALELREVSNSVGFIVIYGKKNEASDGIFFEQLLKEAIVFWKFDMSRFVFAHGENKENLEAEFWIVPPGAENPGYAEGNWSYELEVKKAYMFSQNYFGMSGVCEPTLSAELYSKFLSANPDLRGNIVIYEPSAKKFRRSEKTLLDELVSVHKVPRNKLKTFYVKKEFSGIEFWLVPRKKK